VRIAPGISLGYRRNATAGTWVVRVASGDGNAWTKRVGTADDLDDVRRGKEADLTRRGLIGHTRVEQATRL